MSETPKKYSPQKEYEQLIDELKNGSDQAAQRLVERYGKNILRAIRKEFPRAIRSKVESHDVLQSVWLSIIVKRNDLTEFDTPQRLVAYLVRTAKLKVLEKYRRYTRLQAFDVRREKRLSEPIDPTSPTREFSPLAKNALLDYRHDDPNAAVEAREALERLVSRCSDRDQEIIHLRLKGKTYDLIAQELGISSRTVKRAMQEIKQMAIDG